MQRLAEQLKRQREPGDPRPARGQCPDCAIPLATRSYPSVPGLTLPGCIVCQGVWLSHMDLAQIAAGQAGPSPEYRAPGPASTPAGPAPKDDPFRRAKPQGKPATPFNPYKPEGKPEGPRLTRLLQKRSVEVEPVTGRKLCPECRQPNEADAASCWACGAAFPGAHLPACPGCGGRLRAANSDGVPLAGCADCSGTFVEAEPLDELIQQHGYIQERLIQAMEKEFSGGLLTPNDTVYCPSCRVPMQPKTVGLLSVEPVLACPKCASCYLERGMLRVVLTGRRGPL